MSKRNFILAASLAIISFSEILSSAGEPLRPAGNFNGVIRFRNGDLLSGALQSIDPKSGIRWMHPDALQAVDFATTNVGLIQFSGPARPSQVSSNTCRVRLTNGDELEGNLLVCDEEKLILETWYAGAITLPRKMAQVIAPVPVPRPSLFDGFTGIQGWTVGKVSAPVMEAGVWRYTNGAIYATRAASIARDLKLPALSSIEFDLAWKNLFHIAIALYTDYLHPINLATKDTESEFGGFYSLQLNNFSVNLLAVKKNVPLLYPPATAIPVLTQKDRAHIEIRVNKPKRLIALLIDGVMVKQWIDTEEFAGKGTGLRFVHQGQGSVRLSNLRITEWDGQFEEPAAPVPDGKEDVARLRNGDKVAGILQSIRDGKFTFLAAGTPLDVPMSRVKQLDFAAQKTERAKFNPGDVRVFFARGGSVTFQLERWDDHGVVADSPNFGKATFNPSAFDRIRFSFPPP